ncbi:hypothetical protein [Gluconobacter oxydans]|uniref:Uncharacterized protein n=1 Tax=Gluconobacter oxydans TaxID=442 RepID=A0AB35ARQ6_GLUOY|nr:hypothetical protein [Gluconobacter oxydans]KXV36427.1 hypothetical protein AD939_00295 [Gluconobacter oxydans]MBF0857553.1 hypothetical protein [Gluconobacter oxydans]
MELSLGRGLSEEAVRLRASATKRFTRSTAIAPPCSVVFIGFLRSECQLRVGHQPCEGHWLARL